MSVLKTAWANLQDGLGNRFSWSHVKAIFYNYAEQKLLSTKLDEMDALIDEKIAKAMMSNVQVNDQNKVPTSALAYAMQQQITENEEAITGLNNNIGYNYSYDGVKTFNEVYSNMSLQSTILFEIAGGSTIANELNYPNNSDFGAIIFAWKVRTWRGGAIAIPGDGWANTPIYIGMISGEANNFKWLPLVTNSDLPNIYTEYNVANSNVVFRCEATDGSAIQLATTGTQIQLQKRTSSSGSFETVWAK